MLSNKNKYLFYLILLNGLLITFVIGWGKMIFNEFIPIAATATAIVMFFLYELSVIIITETKSEILSSRQLINLLMGFKVGKIILSLVFVAIYSVVFKIELKRFVMVFVLLYFIFLLFDTLYLSKREKILRRNQFTDTEIDN